MKTLACREAGFDCDYIVTGETVEEIFQKGGEHAPRGSWDERRRYYT